MQFFEDSTCFQKHLGKSFSEIENPYTVSPYLYYMSHVAWVKPQTFNNCWTIDFNIG